MQVKILSHYGAVILTNAYGKTMLVQSEADIEAMLPRDWEYGDEVEISDEYADFFECANRTNEA